jgi:hypothetical protein
MFPKHQLYNFLYTAGSKLGSVLSEQTKLLMSKSFKGLNKGMTPANKGKLYSEDEKLLINLKKVKSRYKPVYFFYDMNNLVTVYESFNEARRQEKCRSNTLLSCIKEGKLFKGFKVSYSYKINNLKIDF